MRDSKGLGKTSIVLMVLVVLAVATITTGVAHAADQASVNLGAAANFGVLAGTTVTNTGFTNVVGDLGVSPGSAVTGFPPGTVTGTEHIADITAAQAQTDLTTAYNDLAGRTGATPVSGNIGGQTFTPGLYKSTSSLEITSGDLTLDAQGNASAIFIFQIASTLTTTTGRKVILTGGANAFNVFWQVGSSATIGTYSVFKGNILALTSITVTTGALVDGRMLARNGAVTLDSNTVGQALHLGNILAPASSTNPFGTPHTVTVTVAGIVDPVVGRNVTFRVVSGPNAGLTSSVLTNSSGQASFTYMTSSSPGTDTIEASFVNNQGATVISNQVTKTWTGTFNPPPKPVGGEILPIDTLSVFLSQYGAVIALLIILLVPLGFLLVKKRNKVLSLIIRLLPHL